MAETPSVSATDAIRDIAKAIKARSIDPDEAVMFLQYIADALDHEIAKMAEQGKRQRLDSGGDILQQHQLQDVSNGAAVTKASMHQMHYRSCNCLGDKATCCDPRCCPQEITGMGGSSGIGALDDWDF